MPWIDGKYESWPFEDWAPEVEVAKGDYQAIVDNMTVEEEQAYRRGLGQPIPLPLPHLHGQAPALEV